MNSDVHRNSNTAIPQPGAERIYASGEMADLVRAYPWQDSPLGSIEQWPDTLLIVVNTMLDTRHPMFLWWGPDKIQIYNDGYRPYIRSDKHPKALGQSGPECWPEIWHIIGPQIDGVMLRGESTWFEDALVPIFRDGKLVDVYWTYSYSPVRSPDGTIHGTLVTCSDTTARVLAERELRASEERLRMALTAAHGVGAWDWDIGKDRVYSGGKFAELFGVDPAQAASGVPIAQFMRNIHPDDRPRTELAIAEVLETGGEFSAEYRLLQRDRSARWVQAIGRCILAEDGTPLRFPGIVIDITERKHAESALRQTEKLAAVGRLASSIAHEINNPLEAITNLLYLTGTTALPDEAKGYIATAQQELARVANIATQTLRFHRQSTYARETSLIDVIDSVLTLLHGKIKNCDVEIVRQYRTERTIQAYGADLRQVVVNLVSNALDASRNGGKIVIRVRDARGPGSETFGVRVTVSDSGSGMSAETLRHIFEPFFTTKGATGTGLGLWVSYEILRNHRAVVKIRSSQRKNKHGTTFSIFLPQS